MNRRAAAQPKGPSPERAAAEAVRTLKRLRRPAGDFDARRYFRGEADLGFYNVRTNEVRALARAIQQTHGSEWSVDEAMRFADRLIVDRYLEVKGVAIELVARYRRHFEPRLLPTWKRWLADGHSANWATTDGICGYLIGPLIAKHPNLVEKVRTWVHHDSLWVRRASAVSLVGLVRRGNVLDVAYEVAAALHADKEDLIQKAVGWMLREAGHTDEKRLERYLLRNGPNIPRTTLRYAIERMPPSTRRRLLAATRLRRSGAAIR